MARQELAQKYIDAGAQFNERTHRNDGARVAASTDDGLTVLRDLLYIRLHEDVERTIGEDSILMPVSEKKTELATKPQIELYHIAESVAAVQEFGCLPNEQGWYLEWVTRLRLGETAGDPRRRERLADYLAHSPDKRRLAFTDILAKVLPESRRAPLVLFRLLPLAVQIATVLAFGDHTRAARLRDCQAGQLPAITDCRQCRGRVLENGEQCPACGNPLWKAEWLTAVD
jgi:hypothetical protein